MSLILQRKACLEGCCYSQDNVYTMYNDGQRYWERPLRVSPGAGAMGASMLHRARRRGWSPDVSRGSTPLAYTVRELQQLSIAE